MRPSRHLVTSTAFSLALAPWLLWKSLLVLAGGALLDLDRYLWHVLRFRTWEVRSAMERFQGRDRIRGGPRFFHSIEFVALLAGAGFISPPFWLFALGAVFHILLDLLVHKKRGRFWFYLDSSHLHCLLFELLRARHVGTQRAALSASDNASEDDE